MMKTSFKSLISLWAILSITSGLALAEDNGPAEIEIVATGCGVVDQFGNPYSVPGDRVSISANSENGNINFTCTLEEQPNDSGRAIVFNFDLTGRLCRTANGLTEDWHQVITANGQTKLNCHYKD